jgi:hypothetical protein
MPFDVPVILSATHMRAGIIGGLLAYCIIGGANWILDKAAELCQTRIGGSDTQLPTLGTRSFITRIASNTGSAAQVGFRLGLLRV